MANPRLLSISFLLVVLLAPLSADEASRAAKVEEFFRLTRMESTYSQMMDLIRRQTGAQFVQQLTGVQLPPQYQKDLEDFQSDVFALMDSEMGWERMKPEYIRLYAEAYTEEELDAIVAFYRTPAGQSMVAKTPALMEKSSVLSQAKMALIAPKVQERMQTFVRQMAEKAAQSTPNQQPGQQPKPQP